MSKREVLEAIGLADSSRRGWFAKMIRDGLFPAPVLTGTGRGEQSYWNRSQVEEWLSLRSGQDRLDIGGETYLSGEEICRQLKRSDRTLADWIQKGKIPPPDMKLGRRSVKSYWKLSTLDSAKIWVD